MDLLMYISRNAPELSPNEIIRYPISNDWGTIITESNRHSHDDGHFSKLIRALKNGETVCGPFEGQAEQRGLKVTGDMWLKIGNMGKSSSKFNNSCTCHANLYSTGLCEGQGGTEYVDSVDGF